MFPSKKRLPRADFPLLLKNRRISSDNFSLVSSVETKGFAVVVSKKTAQQAVIRHRIKRRVLRALQTTPSLPQALILFPKATTNTMKYEDIRTELAMLLSKIKN